MFVTVSVVFMFCYVLTSLLLNAATGDDDTVSWFVFLPAILLPAAGASGAFLYVARFESGRKRWAVSALFFGSLAATFVLGLLFAAVAAGGFAVFARRLLDGGSGPPPS